MEGSRIFLGDFLFFFRIREKSVLLT